MRPAVKWQIESKESVRDFMRDTDKAFLVYIYKMSLQSYLSIAFTRSRYVLKGGDDAMTSSLMVTLWLCAIKLSVLLSTDIKRLYCVSQARTRAKQISVLVLRGV
jgi:hypothetical protein